MQELPHDFGLCEAEHGRVDADGTSVDVFDDEAGSNIAGQPVGGDDCEAVDTDSSLRQAPGEFCRDHPTHAVAGETDFFQIEGA